MLESEERYRALFDHSLNLVYLVDFEANFIDANDAALNRLGYTKEEMSSLNFASLLDEDQLSIAFKNTLDIIETGQQKNVLELRLRHKDGTDVYVETQGSVVMSNGKPSAIQAIALDITERKQAEDALRSSEERYRTIIETIPDAYFEADLAGNNTFCNNQYLVLTGYTKEELQGLNFRKLFDSQNAALTYKILNEVYRTGQPTMHAQFELINKAGERKYLESSISLIRDSQGKPVGFRGISRDITEKLQQAVLAFHSQKLESVGQLAAGIAHEINTPIQFIGDNIHFMKGAFQDILSLSAILNAVKKDDLLSPAVARDLLSRIQEKKKEIDLDFLEEEMPKAIEQSLDGLQRVSRIVQAMREFSHPGGEDMSDMNINKAIESTITLTKNEWKYSAELTTKLAPDLPIVQGYPADLNQVILNLIVNAAQALQEKVGKEGSEKERIEISTRQDGNEVEICIRDTGPGIPPEIQSRIFDPFFTTKALGKGTGQGLAIAQNIIVRKHGGKIFFETKPGEGTAFYIRLPLNKESTGQML